MTVSYSRSVATARFSCFLKLLLRWRGSIYKLLWKDFAVFAGLFYTLSFVYRFLLSGLPKKMFVRVALYCQQFNSLIPVAFVLGFYVSIVVSRWWEQFKTIPHPTRMALFVSTLVNGSDERARLMRRTIMRYLCLTHVMTMSSISPPVKKRFPTLEHVQEAGFLLGNEQKVIEEMNSTYSGNKYFVPLVWAAALVARARKEGRVKDDFAVKTLVDEINEFRGKCGQLFSYDFVTVPLVYTQFLEEGEGPVGDLYFPFFTFLQFFFYMGWLKVAETLLNPFGEDDDDFDINGMIDKNLKVSYLIVDEMHDHHPELLKDQYWDSLNFEVPYTEASQAYHREDYVGSAVDIDVPESKAQFVNTSLTMLAEEDEGEVVSSRRSSAAGGEEHKGVGSKKGKSKRESQKPIARQPSRLGEEQLSKQLSSIWKPGARRPSKHGGGGGGVGEGGGGVGETGGDGEAGSSIPMSTIKSAPPPPHSSSGRHAPVSLTVSVPTDGLGDVQTTLATSHEDTSFQPADQRGPTPSHPPLSHTSHPYPPGGRAAHHPTLLEILSETQASSQPPPAAQPPSPTGAQNLSPVDEKGESVDAFYGLLQDQLKSLREGRSRKN